MPVETAVARVRSRPAERNRYIDMELQYRLRDEYLSIARENGGIILDSMESPEQTHRRIMAAVMEKTAVAGKLEAA